MHLACTIAVILTALKWGDWKHWQKYHTTMLFSIIGSLLYNYLYCNHYLWKMKVDFFVSNFIVVELLYSFIVLPLTVLLFLTNYPTTIKGQILRNIKYIVIYIVIEWIYYKLGRIVYDNGWNAWWSMAWDCMMFPVWVLHYKRPIRAYSVSFAFVIIFLLLFPISP